MLGKSVITYLENVRSSMLLNQATSGRLGFWVRFRFRVRVKG